MTFKHCLSFALNSASNFGCYQFRIMPEIASKLLHTHHHQKWLCCFIGILADSFLRQVVDLDLLCCTGFYWGHAIFFLCLIFSLFGLQQIWQNPSTFHFFGHHQCWAWALKKSLTRPSCFPYFWELEIRKKWSHWPGCQSALRLYNDVVCSSSTIAIISSHVPGPYMWANAGQGPSSSSPKQWKSDGCIKMYN